MRVKRRTRRVEEIPFGLRDQAQAKVKKIHDGYIYTHYIYTHSLMPLATYLV